MLDKLAIVFKLDQSAVSSSVETLDLMPLLADSGYQMGISSGDGVDDVLTLHLAGADYDTLAASVQQLDYMLTRIERFEPMLEDRYPFLEVQLDGETNYRIAPIYAVRRPDKVDVTGLLSTGYGSSGVVYLLHDYQVTLTRGPWENDADVQVTDTAVDCLGGVVEYDVEGDLPARVRWLNILPITDMDESNEFWVGCKSARRLTNYASGSQAGALQDLAEFVPWWALKDASYFGVDTTGGNSDTGNKAASTVVCTFATAAAMAPRTVIRIGDVIGSEDNVWNNAGRYAILLRAKVTGTCKAIALLGMGYNDDGATPTDNYLRLYSVPIESSDWKLYNLGTVDFPVKQGGLYMSNFALQIEAERETGTTGTLVMDGLVIMPALEGMLYVNSVSGMSYDSGSGAGTDYVAFTNPMGELTCYLKDLSSFLEKAEADGQGFGAEPGEGIFVFASQCADPAQTISFDIYLRERWITLRGTTGT